MRGVRGRRRGKKLKERRNLRFRFFLINFVYGGRCLFKILWK